MYAPEELKRDKEFMLAAAAQDGGGIDAHGTLSLRECYIEDCNSDQRGGGVSLHETVATMVACVIRGNFAKGGGGVNTASSAVDIVKQ